MYSFRRIEGERDWSLFRELVQNTPQTSFTMHPDWLDGYTVFPFVLRRTGYLLFDASGAPVAGIAGIRLWKGGWIHLFPSDPLSTMDDAAGKTELLRRMRKAIKGRIHLSSSLTGLDGIGFREGHFPGWMYVNPGIGSVPVMSTEESQLTEFKYQVRRNVKRSVEQGLEIERLTSRHRLREFYDICKLNADQSGYRIKPFFLYRRMWVRGLNNGTFHFLLATHQGRVKGGIWLIESGRMLHNIMGGSVKEKPRLEVGYFLQWSAIRLSMDLGLVAYNISVGGPKGVEAFKDDFGREILNRTRTYISD